MSKREGKIKFTVTAHVKDLDSDSSLWDAKIELWNNLEGYLSRRGKSAWVNRERVLSNISIEEIDTTPIDITPFLKGSL